MRKLQIAVIGSAGLEEYKKKKPDRKAYMVAYDTGKYIAQLNAILVCGGMGGVMEEACRGAKENDGITVGIVSGLRRNQVNPYVDVEIVSGMMNCSEENLIISMSDGVIAIGGGSGTLQEIAIAYRLQKPIIAISSVNGWAKKVANTYLDEREILLIGNSLSAKEAINKLMNMINSKK